MLVTISALNLPTTGKNTEKETQNPQYSQHIAEEYLDIAKHKAQDLINEGKKRSEELVTEAKKKASNLLEDANKILNVAKEKTSTAYESTKGKVNEEGAKLKDAIKAGVDAYKDERNKNQG